MSDVYYFEEEDCIFIYYNLSETLIVGNALVKETHYVPLITLHGLLISGQITYLGEL